MLKTLVALLILTVSAAHAFGLHNRLLAEQVQKIREAHQAQEKGTPVGWIKDPTKRLEAARLPTHLPHDDHHRRLFLFKNFQALARAVHAGPGERKKMENSTALLFDGYRWIAFVDALKQRGEPNDIAMLQFIKSRDGVNWCSICEWVVGQLKSKISDYGCDAIADTFADVCGAIPYIGPFTIPECVAVLKWGCGKLLEYIMDGVQSNSQLCYDVFSVCGDSR